VADKAFGMGSVGGCEHTCPLELNDLDAAEVDVGRGVEAKPRVAVLVVVLMRVIGDHRTLRARISRDMCGNREMFSRLS